MRDGDAPSPCASARASSAAASASTPNLLLASLESMQVTLIQTASGDDKPRNLAEAERLVRAAIEATRPDLVVLPELFAYLGGTAAGAMEAAEAIPGGEAYKLLSGLARQYG